MFEEMPMVLGLSHVPQSLCLRVGLALDVFLPLRISLVEQRIVHRGRDEGVVELKLEVLLVLDVLIKPFELIAVLMRLILGSTSSFVCLLAKRKNCVNF